MYRLPLLIQRRIPLTPIQQRNLLPTLRLQTPLQSLEHPHPRLTFTLEPHQTLSLLPFHPETDIDASM